MLALRVGRSLLLPPPPPPTSPSPIPSREPVTRPRRAERGENDLEGGDASFFDLVRFEEIFETCIQGEEEWEEEEWEKER